MVAENYQERNEKKRAWLNMIGETWQHPQSPFFSLTFLLWLRAIQMPRHYGGDFFQLCTCQFPDFILHPAIKFAASHLPDKLFSIEGFFHSTAKKQSNTQWETQRNQSAGSKPASSGVASARNRAMCGTVH